LTPATIALFLSKVINFSNIIVLEGSVKHFNSKKKNKSKTNNKKKPAFSMIIQNNEKKVLKSYSVRTRINSCPHEQVPVFN